MVQNLTGMIVAANVTGTTTNNLNYQALGVIIAATALTITLAVTLATVLYKYGQQVGEIKGLKQIIDAKIESIDEKYNTSEMIQHIQLDIQKIESKIELKSNKDDVNTHIYEITNRLSKLDEEIEALKKQGNKVGLDWINRHLNIDEIKNLIQEKGLLQNFVYYNKSEQQIKLLNNDWDIKLERYEELSPLQVALIFRISIAKNIIVKKEKTSQIGNIRLKILGNISKDELLIIPDYSEFRWEEI